MAVVQSPIVRRTIDDAEEAYRGFARSQMAILKQYMDTAKLSVYSRVVTLSNGVVITCSKCFNREDIHIAVPPKVKSSQVEIATEFTGIILHPRSGQIIDTPWTYQEYTAGLGTITKYSSAKGVAGGWESGKTELTTSYVYPQVDEDGASFYLKTIDPDNGRFLGRNKDYYGNIYWTNGAVFDGEKWDKPLKILSWKGTPTRHFALPESYNIPGFSTYHHDQELGSGDAPRFSAFSQYIYSMGRRVKSPKYSWPYADQLDSRCLILGAAVSSADKKVYIVTTSDQYNAPPFIKKWSDGTLQYGEDKPEHSQGASVIYYHPMPQPEPVGTRQPRRGVYLQLWRVGALIDGWDKVWESTEAYTGGELPWYADADCTIFTCSNGDKLTTSGVFTKKETEYGSFSLTAHVSTGDDSFSYSLPPTIQSSGYKTDYHEIELSAGIRYSFNANGNQVGGKSKMAFWDGKVKDLGVDTELIITGPTVLNGTGSYPNIVASAGQTWVATGGSAPYTYSASFNINPSTGVALGGDKPCGTGSVTVTDACGNTDTMEVRMPNGKWVPDYGASYVPEDFYPNVTYLNGYDGSCTGCLPGQDPRNIWVISGSKRYKLMDRQYLTNKAMPQLSWAKRGNGGQFNMTMKSGYPEVLNGSMSRLNYCSSAGSSDGSLTSSVAVITGSGAEPSWECPHSVTGVLRYRSSTQATGTFTPPASFSLGCTDSYGFVTFIGNGYFYYYALNTTGGSWNGYESMWCVDKWVC